jgi:SepF-like predicted cell division protein (DUF552 family)
VKKNPKLRLGSHKIRKRLTADTTYKFQLERKNLHLFGLFRKSKKEEESKMEESSAAPASKTATQAPESEDAHSTGVELEETVPEEKQELLAKTYLKAMPLRDLADLENIKSEVRNGNILIIKVTPLANKSIQDVSKAVDELYQFAESIGGDIARLGEERIVICPPKIKIWREKTPVPSEPLPTAA